MNRITACNRELFIEKLKDLNFHGPVAMSGHQFMLYHGNALCIPLDREFSIAQFRFMLSEVESIVSQDEWQY